VPRQPNRPHEQYELRNGIRHNISAYYQTLQPQLEKRAWRPSEPQESIRWETKRVDAGRQIPLKKWCHLPHKSICIKSFCHGLSRWVSSRVGTRRPGHSVIGRVFYPAAIANVAKIQYHPSKNLIHRFLLRLVAQSLEQSRY